MAVDPLSEIYAGMSAYNYVGNNPINSIDPNGMSISGVNQASGSMPDGFSFRDSGIDYYYGTSAQEAFRQDYANSSPDDWIKLNGRYQYDADVTNGEQAVAKYGGNAEYIGETYKYRAANGGSVQLNRDGTWNYLGAPYNPPMLSPGAVNEFFNDYNFQVGASDVLAASGTNSMSQYVKSRGYNSPVGQGNKLSPSDIRSLRYRTFLGTVKGKNVVRLSNTLKNVGRSAALFGYLSITNSALQGDITRGRAAIDYSVVTYSLRGGTWGAAFGFGYGVLGPIVTSSDVYQNFKYRNTKGGRDGLLSTDY